MVPADAVQNLLDVSISEDEKLTEILLKNSNVQPPSCPGSPEPKELLSLTRDCICLTFFTGSMSEASLYKRESQYFKVLTQQWRRYLPTSRRTILGDEADCVTMNR